MTQALIPEKTFPAPGINLCGMAWDGKYLWHSDASTDLLYQIDSASGSVLAEIPCPEARTDLAFDGTNLWQIAGRPKRIIVIDPAEGMVVMEISLGPDREHACGLCIAENHYFVAFEQLAKIEAHSQGDHQAIREFAALPRVAGLEIVGDTLWYTEYEKSLLVGLDLSSGKELHRYRIPGNPTGLCWDGERFWYSDFANRRISAIRPM